MTFDTHVGRVGGLAVALGIGAALATGWSCPAWADGNGGSSATSASSTSDASGSSGAQASSGSATGSGESAGSQTGGADAKDDAGDSAGTDSGSEEASDQGAGQGSDEAAAGDESESESAEADQADGTGVESDDESNGETGDSAGRHSSSRSVQESESDSAADAAGDAPEDAQDAGDSAEEAGGEDALADDPADALASVTAEALAEAGTEGSATAQVQLEPAETVSAEPDTTPETTAETIVAAVSDLVDADTESTSDPVSPLAATAALTLLAAANTEVERLSAITAASSASAQVTSALSESLTDTTPNVLLIGVDGTNLARILADPENASFFTLMQDGTTAASSIVGHTTISNPSWTAILTGVWGETTGVINNIYNPAVYDAWPTVFTQLESLDSAISTTAIADWDVIAAIAASGSVGADNVLYVPQITGDTDWSQTDDAVGDATVAAIEAADPSVANFIFGYFVGVDENGHMYGGASEQYAEAIRNVDENLAEIMAAVSAWEALTGEQWTVIVVTDHGHQAEQGVGHGFQSPDETSTFVIADNPDIFTAGAVNLAYEIVDVTPTVVTLFGGTTPSYSDGVSITTLGDSDVMPINDDEALRTTLQDIIDMNGYPDIATDLALSARTIFASVPYFVDLITEDITSTLQGLADQGIFLVSPLASLAIVPVQLIGDGFYIATNIVAQIVAWLTGVSGASIFPLLPAPLPSFDTLDESASSDVCAVPGAGSAYLCGDAVAV